MKWHKTHFIDALKHTEGRTVDQNGAVKERMPRDSRGYGGVQVVFTDGTAVYVESEKSGDYSEYTPGEFEAPSFWVLR